MIGRRCLRLIDKQRGTMRGENGAERSVAVATVRAVVRDPFAFRAMMAIDMMRICVCRMAEFQVGMLRLIKAMHIRSDRHGL